MKKEFSIKELIDQDWLSVTHGARDFRYSEKRKDYKITEEVTLVQTAKYAEFVYSDMNRGERLLSVVAIRIENSKEFNFYKITERWRISVSSTPLLFTVGWFLSFFVKRYKEKEQIFRVSLHPVVGLDDSKIEEIKTYLNISIRDVTHMEVFY